MHIAQWGLASTYSSDLLAKVGAPSMNSSLQDRQVIIFHEFMTAMQIYEGAM